MSGPETITNPPFGPTDVRLERIVQAFEAAWGRGLRPRIDDYLPDDADRDVLLVELAHVDLEFALKAGRPARVEAYLDRYPRLGARPDVVLELISTEWEQRRRREPDLTPVEYLERFPRYRDRVAALLQPTQPPANGTSRSYTPADTPPPPGTLRGHRTPPAGGVSETEPSVEDSEVPTGAYTDGSDAEKLKEGTQTVPTDAGPSPQPPTATEEAAPSATPMLSGRQPCVAGYEILGELGRGGMGVVYKARQTKLKRTVALKMILAGAHAGVSQRLRFRTEAEAVARLQHPNIVQIFEIGEQDNLSYLALEYVNGGSLSHQLGGRPLPDRDAAALLETLARAMHFAHQKGIVHRDLKPANILLQISDCGFQTSDFKSEISNLQSAIPKITDFGLAKRIDESGATASGAILGTPCYMAPEQAGGRSKDTGPLADVYALGAMLYEFLTGRPPFNAPRPLDTVMQVLRNEPVPPSRFQPKVARDLETICLKCLQKDPRRRYASAEALADDARRFLDSKPIRARPISVWERGWKWACRRPAVATALVLTVLLAISSVVVGLLWAQTRLAAQQAQSEVVKLIDDGQRAADSENAPEDWKKGQDLAERALARIETDRALEGMRPRAEAVLAEAMARQKARALHDEFVLLRDRALFLHATLSTGEGSRINRPATADRSRQALQELNVSVGSSVPAVLDNSFSRRDKEEIVAGCYELVMILAELESPSQARATLVWGERSLPDLAPDLKQSPEPRWPPWAYYRRLERCAGQDEKLARGAREGAARRQPTAFDYYLEGDDAFRRHDLGKAVADFQKVIGMEPDHFWAWYFLSVCYLRLGRPDVAERGLSRCLDRRKDFVWLYLMRGYAEGQLAEKWDQRGGYEAAERDYQAALDLLNRGAGKDTDTAGDAAARYVLLNNRAVMRVGQWKFGEGLADLREAIRANPDDYRTYVSLGTTYEAASELEDAAAQQVVAWMLGSARSLASPLLHSRYRQALTRSLLAFDRAVDQFDRSGEKENSVLARLYSSRALLHQKRGDRAAALADFDRAIRADQPGSLSLARSLASKGRLLELDHRDADAVAAYDAAIRTQPDYTNAYLWKAGAHFRLGTPADLAAVITSIGTYLARGGEPTAAVFALRGRAHMRLIAPGTPHQARAVADFTRALGHAPADWSLYQERGYAYLEGMAYTSAEYDFTEAIDRHPASAESYYGRSWARMKQGHLAKAVADAEETLRRTTEPSPRQLHRVARIYGLALADLDRQAAVRDRRVLDDYGRYLRRAVDLLRQAQSALPPAERATYWWKEIEPDLALRALHRSSEYRQLAERFPRPRPSD